MLPATPPRMNAQPLGPIPQPCRLNLSGLEHVRFFVLGCVQITDTRFRLFQLLQVLAMVGGSFLQSYRARAGSGGDSCTGPVRWRDLCSLFARCRFKRRFSIFSWTLGGSEG